MTKSDHQTLWELIKDIKFCMMTHRHPDGSLQSQPLTTQNKSIDEGNSLYFFISKKSQLSNHLHDECNVNLAYSDPSADKYVSIAGCAQQIYDQTTKERLWSPINKAWFPGGITDPDLELIQIKISHAEYWNITESKMTQLFQMAKAAVTGHPPKARGEHKELGIS